MAAEAERRRLGAGSAAALVVGNMVGAGVFTTSGFALAALGSPEAVLAAWAVGGLLALAGALSYGALARRIPESGGEYTFLTRTVHPLAGFLAGWVSLLAGFSAPIAAAALGLEAYLAAGLGVDASPGWIATAAVLAAGAQHGLRLRVGVRIQDAAVALKLALVAAFVAVGAAGLSGGPGPGPALPALPEAGAFAVSLVWISFAYSGWNAAVYVAGEVRDPERGLSRALVAGTGAVIAVYLALNAVFLYAAPASELAGRAEVGAVAAQALGGAPLRRALSLLVALALFTSVSAMVMAGPRVYARMAEEGLFPRGLAERRESPVLSASERRETAAKRAASRRRAEPGPPGRMGARDGPTAAVALQVALAAAGVWWADLLELLGYIGFTLGLSAAATVAGLVRLRLREGPARVPVPGWPWLPVLFVTATLAVSAFMVARRPGEAAFGLLTVAAGLPVYAWRRHAAGR